MAAEGFLMEAAASGRAEQRGSLSVRLTARHHPGAHVPEPRQATDTGGGQLCSCPGQAWTPWSLPPEAQYPQAHFLTRRYGSP